MDYIRLSYMPQDSSSLIPPYMLEQGIRRAASAKSDLWSTPSSSKQGQPSSAVWAPPLSAPSKTSSVGTAPSSPLPNALQGSFIQPSSLRHPLAALAANSEPISTDENISNYDGHAKVQNSLVESNTTPGGATTSSLNPAGSAGSVRMASRHSSTSEAASPLSGGSSLLASPSGSTVPNTPTLSSSQGPSAVGSSFSIYSTKSSGESNSALGPSDEIINTAIVVKNIPFAIKKEQLIDFMTQLGLPLPYAFNYHFDNGVFRGLAFANFATAEETAAVIASLNGRELGGRKLRVEYKKMLPYQERERIEREKRERRGQLEEQHQKSDNISSASHVPAQPTNSHSKTSGTSVAPQNTPYPSSSGGSQRLSSVTGSFNGSMRPLSSSDGINSLGSASSTSSHLSLNQGYTNLPSPMSHSVGSSVIGTPAGNVSSSAIPGVDLNDPQTLDIYSSLLGFTRDLSRDELLVPANQAAHISVSQGYAFRAISEKLDLICELSEDQGLYIAKKGDNRYAVDNTGYLSGVLRSAMSSDSLYLRHSGRQLSSAMSGSTSNQTQATTTVAGLASSTGSMVKPIHQSSFAGSTKTSTSDAQAKGLDRWNSVGGLNGMGSGSNSLGK